MKRKTWVFLLAGCLALLFFLHGLAVAADVEPKVGQTLGKVKFLKPLSDEDAKYLGLDKAAEFTLKDIKAPYVFIESMNTA
ncbi:MAG: hypothetical protein FJ134_03985 [Deltaproteobacteria bacterium]|nr:hypothetical protein [Deltaproteobacteria bacterium]